MKKEETLRGYDAYKARLNNGENVKFREGGNSMVPKIYSRQECEYTPVTSPDQVRKGDIVWCKVKGNHNTCAKKRYYYPASCVSGSHQQQGA